MTEDSEPEPAPFDAEWEIQKMRGRFTDILNMIEELRSKDRTLSARISRLRRSQIEEGEEEPEEPREPSRPDIEDMSIEDRAIFYSDLLDKLKGQPLNP